MNGEPQKQEDLRVAENLIKAQLDAACGDAKTKLPTGLTIRQYP